jgi:hypothetical protein
MQEMVILKIKTSTIMKITIVALMTAAGLKAVAETILPSVQKIDKKLKQDLANKIVNDVIPDEYADNTR